MIHKQIAAFFVIFSFCFSFAQDVKPYKNFEKPLSKHAKKKNLKQARKLFFKGKYSTSKEKYIQLLKADSANFTYNFEMGLLLYYTWTEELRSIPYFERALRHSPKDSLGEIYFCLGDVYQIGGRPTLAHSYYTKFLYRLEKGKTDMPASEKNELIADVKHRMEQCKNAETMAVSRYMNAIEINGKVNRFNIRNSGAGINSSFDDYSPVLSQNDSTLFFTSRRKESSGGKIDEDDDKYFEDIYSASLEKDTWTAASNIGKPINTKRHEASNFISLDGKVMYIYKGVKRGSIYKTEKNGKLWEKPKRISTSLNSRTWETSSIVVANNTLYIVSDRKGGIGGRDIYKCAQKQDGSWGEQKIWEI